MLEEKSKNVEKLENNESKEEVFGDLYEWTRRSVPNYSITSLLISDDVDFCGEDLAVICQLAPLRQLFLHNLPKFEALPPQIARLAQLRVLSVTHCPSLTVLSLAVRYLCNLETLRLNCPSVTQLPSFLCLMPSLNLLLLQKSVAICAQCKGHIRKSPRFILTFHDDLQSKNVTPAAVLPLTVLAAHAHLSILISPFYNSIPLKMLWPFFEEALLLEKRCCSMCLASCSPQNSLTINCTRIFDCKCVHLHGYICSERCKVRLLRHLSLSCPSAEILILSQSPLSLSNDNFNAPLAVSLWRRVKKSVSRWPSCIPRYHKKSYTVTAV